MTQFLLTTTPGGGVYVQKATVGPGPNGTLFTVIDEDFQPVQLNLEDRLDLHLEGESGQRMLVTISVDDDRIPQFSSTEEAEEWMDRRARQVIR